MKKTNRKEQVMDTINDCNNWSLNEQNFITSVVDGLIPEYGWFRRLVIDGTLPTKYEVARTVSDKCYKWLGRREICDMPTHYRSHAIRRVYSCVYSWPLITREFINSMAQLFNGQRVLEVMSGSGYLASSLADAGVDIRCTDNMTWGYQHLFTDVQELDAIKSVERYHDTVDMILMSWPPYRDEVDCEVLDMARKYAKPLVVIGEIGDCTGSAKFCDTIYGDGYTVDVRDVSYVPFIGIHDCVSVIKAVP